MHKCSEKRTWMYVNILCVSTFTPERRGSGHTFAWLEEELYALDELVAFASKRLEGAADVLEQEFFR